MSKIKEAAGQLAQRDVTLLEQLLSQQQDGQMDIKRTLLNYQDYLARNSLTLQQDSLLYKTIIKMSLIQRYKAPSNSAMSYLSNISNSSRRSSQQSAVTISQRFEMAYQWVYFEHLRMLFHTDFLKRQCFQYMRRSKKYRLNSNLLHSEQKTLRDVIFEQLKSNLAHQSPEYQNIANLQTQPIVDLAGEQFSQSEGEQAHYSRSASDNGQASVSPENIQENKSESIISSSSGTLPAAGGASSIPPSEQEVQIITSVSKSENERVPLQASSRPRRVSRHSGSEQARNRPAPEEQQPAKPNADQLLKNDNVTVNDTINAFLEEQRRNDSSIDEAIKQLSFRDASVPEKPAKQQNPYFMQSISAFNSLSLSSPHQLPINESSILNQENNADFEMFSLIQSIDKQKVITVDEIMKQCAFKALLHAKIQKINTLVQKHAFRQWLGLTIRVVRNSIYLENDIISYYIRRVFEIMRAKRERNNTIIVSAQNFAFHKRNQLCLKTINVLFQQQKCNKSKIVDLHTLPAVFKFSSYVFELQQLDIQIENERQSLKYEFFKNKQIVQLQQQQLLIAQKIKQLNGNCFQIYQIINNIVKIIKLFPSVEAIRNCFYNPQNAAQYRNLVDSLAQFQSSDVKFMNLNKFLTGLHISGYNYIPASVNTLRRPLDYLNFIYGCYLYQMSIKQEFVALLGKNVVLIKSNIASFILRRKFIHWRKASVFKKKMRNIDQFVQDYHEFHILQRLTIKALLLEAGLRKVEALIAPKVRKILLRDSLRKLQGMCKERRFNNYGFLKDIDQRLNNCIIKKAFSTIMEKYLSFDSNYCIIRNRVEERLRKRALGCVMQYIGISMFQASIRQRQENAFKRRFLKAVRRNSELLSIEDYLNGKIVFLYQKVAYQSVIFQYFSLKRGQFKIHQQVRKSKSLQPFHAWHDRYLLIQQSRLRIENTHYAITIKNVAKSIYPTARRLFLLQQYLSKKQFSKLLTFYYIFKQSAMRKRAIKLNIEALVVMKHKQRWLLYIISFWQQYAKFVQLQRANQSRITLAIFLKWKDNTADNKHFLSFKSKLNWYNNLRQQGYFDRLQIESTAAFKRLFDQEKGVRHNLSESQFLSSLQPMLEFVNHDQISKNQKTISTWRFLLSLFQGGQYNLNNYKYTCQYIIFAFRQNALSQKNQKKFLNGLKRRLDQILLKMAFRALKQQEIKEKRICQLIFNVQLQLQGYCFAKLISEFHFLVRKKCFADQQYGKQLCSKAIGLMQRRSNIFKVNYYYIGRRQQQFLLRNAYLAIQQDYRRLTNLYFQLYFKKQKSVMKNVFAALLKHNSIKFIENRIVELERTEKRQILKKCFNILIERTNQFIDFHNYCSDRLEKLAFGTIMKRKQQLHQLEVQLTLVFDRYQLKKTFSICQALNNKFILANAKYQMKIYRKKENLFSRWKYLAKLLSREKQVLFLHQRYQKEFLLSFMIKLVYLQQSEAQFVQKKQQLILQKAQSYLFAYGRAKHYVDCRITSDNQHLLECCYYKIKQFYLFLRGKEQQSQARFVEAYKRKAFAALTAKYLKMKMIAARINPKLQNSQRQLLKLSFGTWMYYFGRIQSVKVAKCSYKKRYQRMALSEMRRRHKHIQAGEQFLVLKSHSQLLQKSYITWRRQYEILAQSQLTAQLRVKQHHDSVLLIALQHLQQKRLQLQQGALLIQNLHDLSVKRHIFIAIKQENWNFKQKSQAVVLRQETILKKTSFVCISQLYQRLNLQCTSMTAKLNRNLSEKAFKTFQLVSRLKKLFLRLKVSFILIQWHRQAAATKSNLRKAEIIRKAQTFAEKQQRRQLSRAYLEMKLKALKYTQMQGAADAFFARHCQVLEKWRDLAWERRRKVRFSADSCGNK